MKKNKIYLGLLLIVSMFNIACDDVLEEDISAELITPVYPLESTTVLSNVTTFQWNLLNGASNYRIQVQKDGGVILLDSLVENNTLSYALEPGNYHWKIRGENFAYSTDYISPIAFNVDLSTDLNDQMILLQTPSDEIYINDTSNVLLNWESLTTATSYDLIIDKTINGTATIVNETGLSDSNYSIAPSLLIDDASYTWKVRGVNSISNTPLSQFVFRVDRVPPNQPQLVLPIADFVQTSLTVAFSWTIPSDTGEVQSPVSYKLEIASDASFTSIIAAIDLSNLSHSYTFSTTGIYYWRVQAVDEAENSSVLSSSRKITIN